MLNLMLPILPFTSSLADTRPNVIYIMADDLGYGELGCYGQEKIPTPNIDLLAKEGIRFTHFYTASPVCAPTRYSLMTGKHQGHAAIRGNKERGGSGPNALEGQTPIPLSETTLAEIFKKAGYRTGIVGKWGLGGPEPGQNPLDHGFDTFYGYLCQRRAHNYYPVYLWRNYQVDLLDNPLFPAHQRINEPLANEQLYYDRYTANTWSPAKLTEACLSFIRNTEEQPFFLHYAPTIPHVALQAPRNLVDAFPSSWDREPYLGDHSYLPNARPRATYAAMIAYLDESVGRIVGELEANGLTQNTLIIFTSDNGPSNAGGADPDFFQSSGGLRSGKSSLYEGGIRMPFIARWPNKIAPGTTSDSTSSAYDMVASFCQILKVGAPKTDGRSILPALLGEDQSREWLYFEYPEGKASQAVILDSRWKVIKPNLKEKPDLVELYDLQKDPTERHDLAGNHPDLIEKGLSLMKRQHRANKEFPLVGVDTQEILHQLTSR